MRAMLVVLVALVACGSSGASSGSSEVPESAPSPCSRAMQVTGVLHTSVGDVALDGASVETHAGYKWDVDAAERGPVGSVDLRVTKGGCGLRLVFSRTTEDAGLHVVTFGASSDCPGFWDASEGGYYRMRLHPGDFAPRWPEGMPTQIAGGNGVNKCVEALSLRFAGMAYTLVTLEATPRLLHVDLSDVVISGDMFLWGTGVNHTTYAVPASCGDGAHDGGDGWCVPLGTCSPGHPIDAQGLCSPFPHL